MSNYELIIDIVMLFMFSLPHKNAGPRIDTYKSFVWDIFTVLSNGLPKGYLYKFYLLRNYRSWICSYGLGYYKKMIFFNTLYSNIKTRV